MIGKNRLPLKRVDGVPIRTFTEIKKHFEISHIDRVAFTQEELIDLLDMNVDIIYLCGERFAIPGNIEGITYIGINNPRVDFGGGTVEPGIDLQGVRFNIEDYIDDGNNSYGVDKFYIFFDNNPILGVKLLRAAAEKGSVKAQTVLGSCCMNGYGIEENRKEAVKWYRIAAEQGYTAAQYMLGCCYKYGDGVERNRKEAIKWFQKAARQDNTDAEYELNKYYTEGNGAAKDIRR